MKLGYIFDCSIQDSFYVKDGTMYDFKNHKPHIFQAAYSPQFTTQIWNYCFFDRCYFSGIIGKFRLFDILVINDWGLVLIGVWI